MKKQVHSFIFAIIMMVINTQLPAQVVVNAVKPSFHNSTRLDACGQPITDSRNGKIYNTVLIGTQCWMAQNLNIGIMIPGDQEQNNQSAIEKFCYDNSEANCTIYGGLYSWDNMLQWTSTPGVRGICPAGWHIPTGGEWDTLVTFLGGLAVAGGKMKETGLEHWTEPNTGASNSSGFTALPAGQVSCTIYGCFHWLHSDAFFWYKQNDPTTAWYLQLYNWGESLLSGWTVKSVGFSVRCIKDELPPVPENRTIKNINIPGGYDSCYNATQTITVAGEGTTFTVQNGGSATMIAGQNIIYQPTTTVYSGGYMNGYITSTGQYCGTKALSLPGVLSDGEHNEIIDAKSSIKVYPNPTASNFILELNCDFIDDAATVELYGIWGEKVLTTRLTGEFRHQFSLSDRPAGVYFIRVIAGDKSETSKIIKQ
ncbi:MAG: T9SS type A sorting domain-containing protein [Bacteroidales bacterium]|jgi:uncharacterized protein (TIGR02145 family)|nr:T9SS type A sorting domain-containing protein [Bacteroidales bacterium]